jgi:DNA polymerase
MAVTQKTVEQFERTFGFTSKAVSRLIRPSFVAPGGHKYVWGDWSAIEARKLPWLAEDEATLDIFRTNDADPSLPDIYKIEAGNIYDVKPTEIDKPRRQVGKVAVLALGFGGAVGALDAMAAGYGLSLERDFMHEIVGKWRARNKKIVDFWSTLESAFHKAMADPETVYEAGRVRYIYVPDYLRGTVFCYLPCGRPITYTDVRREKVTFYDDEGEEQTEWKLRYQKGYERGILWHGILAENITQGSAASILRACLHRLEVRDWSRAWTVGHTHDEIIQETRERDADEAEARLKTEMEVIPDWAAGLPLVAETTQADYYTKALD